MSILKFVSGFAFGFYTALYAKKNYNVPNVPEPSEVYNAVVKIMDKYKKDKPDE